ncbi:MAG: S1C family serine protease, partial [Nitrosotalea sp.]
MKKLEIALIGVIVVLSATVIAQYTDDRFFGDLSQATVQGPAGPPGPQGPPGPTGPAGSTGTSQDSILTDLFEKTQNSVVQITSKVSTVDNTLIINGQPLSSQSTRLGSGFIYDKEGRIITNNHVVEGSGTVNVTFVDGNTYTAKVVGTDPGNDVAVIQIIDNFSDETLVPLALG